MLVRVWKVMMLVSMMALALRVTSQEHGQRANSTAEPLLSAAFAMGGGIRKRSYVAALLGSGAWPEASKGAIATNPLVETKVSGVFRIPGHGVSDHGIGPWGHVVFEEDSAVLVDVPYFSEELAQEIRKRAPKGLKYILLTHDDFVRMSPYKEWKSAFAGQASSVAHHIDAQDMDILLDGAGPWKVGNFEVHYTPGHSAGHVFYMHRGLSAVFTGDSFADFHGPTGFPRFCHFALGSQAASLRGFAEHIDFVHHVLPSHGLPMSFEDQPERLKAFEEAAADLDGGK